MIKLMPSGKEFECSEGESILDGALRSDVYLPHACKDGSCGACKGKIVSGLVTLQDHSPFALTETEKSKGYTLFCRAQPSGNIEIESTVLDELRGIEVKTMPARVESIQKASLDVTILTLRLPKTEKFEFLPGQYIDILLADGDKRSYSIASAEAINKTIELHVRHVPGGKFSSRVCESLKEKEMLRFRGPLGTFFLRKDLTKPIIMVATGTGIAPIKSILEQALHQDKMPPVHFYWGCRTKADLYLLEQIQSIVQKTSWLEFIPTLSAPRPEDNWPGLTGRVQKALRRDFNDFSGLNVYACGSPAMIAEINDLMCANGLEQNSFYADPFYSSYAR